MNQRELSSYGSALAFSLLELTVSLAVVGVLAAIAMPVYRDALNRARLALVHSRCHDISLAYSTYWMDKGRSPETKESCIVKPPSIGKDIEEAIGETDPFKVFKAEFTDRVKPSTFEDPFVNAFEYPPRLVVPTKRCFHWLFKLPLPKEEGCVLASRGPDSHIDTPSFGFINQHMQYSPTNGLASSGDLFLSVPEEEEVRLYR